jgi:hypothetical protein
MEVSGKLHNPGHFTPRKRAPGTLDRRLGGPQIRFGRGGDTNAKTVASKLPPFPEDFSKDLCYLRIKFNYHVTKRNIFENTGYSIVYI